MRRFAWNGLTVACERELVRLASLPESNEPADVSFVDASGDVAAGMHLLVTEAAQASSTAGPFARRLADGCWGIVYRGVGCFHLDLDQRRIMFLGQGEADGLAVEHALVNFVLGVYASLGGRLCLHAVVVGNDAGEAELLCGPSGAGKSTAAAQRLLQGWVLIADDMLVLWPEADHFIVRLGPCRLRLRADSPVLDDLQRRWPSALNSKKHDLAVPHAAADARFRVNWIRIPGPRPASDWQWRPASADPGRAIAVLCGQVPGWFPLSQPERASRFAQVVNLVKGVL